MGNESLTYDANGNLTNDGNGNTLTYDAWNHLVQIYNLPNFVTVNYSYDGLGRLIVIDNTSIPLTIDQYYSSSGQVLEEYYNGLPQARNVWSPVYVNALVLRDYSTNANGVIDSRLYVEQDANWNVTALLAGTTNLGSLGSVLERYDYQPYGAMTVLNPDFSVYDPVLNLDPYGMPYLWQGMEVDLQTKQPTAELYFSEDSDRIYSTQLMGWLQTDPSGLSAGDNLYEGMGNAPTDQVDPSGLDPNPIVNQRLNLADYRCAQCHGSLNGGFKNLASGLETYRWTDLSREQQIMLRANAFNFIHPTTLV